MKHVAVFLMKLGDKNYETLGEKRYKLGAETLAYRDKTFILPRKDETYRTKKKAYIFYDYEMGALMSFNKSDFGIDNKFLDMLISKSIIAQLVAKLRSSMEKPDKWKMLPLILAFLFGILAGYIIADTYLKYQTTANTAKVLLWHLKV